MSRTLTASAYPQTGRALALAAALGGAALFFLLGAEPATAHHAKRPHAPQPLRVVSQGETSVLLAWTRTARKFAVSKDGRRVDVTRRTRHRFRNLRCDRDYRFHVRAITRNGKRSRGAARRVTLPCQQPPPAPAPPVSTQAPNVTGTARAGRILHASQGAWSGSTPMSFTYAWQRCDATGASCTPISGATGANRLLDDSDVGSRLRVEVTATNSVSSASALSGPSAVVSEPTSTGSCSRANAAGCAAVAGSRISLLNQRFSCDRPLAAIAADNPVGSGTGRLPLLVEVAFTTYVDLNPAIVELKNGCVGDGDDETIDLVVRVEGDGRTIGGTSDAVKVRLTARDVQLTGYANCGPRGLGEDGRPDTSDDAHQDGAQIQGGEKIEFIDFEWGDWESNTATCQGAAGTFVPGSVNGHPVVDMACIRCKSVSCNHGMLLGGSTGTLVVDSFWRSGNPADRTAVLANGQVGLCAHAANACTIGDTPVDYTILRNYCDRFPYGDGH